jgi:hypothetical protein
MKLRLWKSRLQFMWNLRAPRSRPASTIELHLYHVDGFVKVSLCSPNHRLGACLAHCLKKPHCEASLREEEKFDMVYGTSPPRFQMKSPRRPGVTMWCLTLCVQRQVFGRFLYSVEPNYQACSGWQGRHSRMVDPLA